MQEEVFIVHPKKKKNKQKEPTVSSIPDLKLIINSIYFKMIKLLIKVVIRSRPRESTFNIITSIDRWINFYSKS